MSNPIKQHYVPETYLKYWSSTRPVKPGEKNAGVRTFNKERNQIRFETDFNSISQIRYFNRLDIDQDVYDMLEYKYVEHKDLLAGVFAEFQVLLKIDEYKQRGLPNADQLNKVNKRFLEDKFNALESRFSKSLNLINADVRQYIESLVNQKNDIKDLLGVFAVQLFRTKYARETVSSAHNGWTVVREGGEKKLSELQSENLLKAMLFIDSLLFGARLGDGEYSVELLITQDSEGFITSNSPAIILSKSDEGQKDLSAFEGFMPLCPSVGLVVRGHRPLGKNFMFRFVGKDEVARFNKKTFDASSYDIYASYDFDGVFGY